jgi:predicted nuclease of restriction endonuclease-like (RecB) superfamily
MKKPETMRMLYDRIRQILDSARASVSRSVNTTQVVANWLVGREIVEEEQNGKKKAGYGDALLAELSVKLVADFGPGYSGTNLRWFRQFYILYGNLLGVRIHHAPRDEFTTPSAIPGCEIQHALRDESFAGILHAPRGVSWTPGQLHPNLSWTHYRTLLRVDKPEARAFYEIEAIKNNWGARELERQICSLLYERLALSRDKRGLMRLATKGHVVQKATDVFKDPVVMEFLGLPESPKLAETDLETTLIDNMQIFLLELSKGFAIEQSIGRGLRLPFGKRTGVSAVDRLSIVAHDRFQEIVDEANRPDSAIRLQQVILDPNTDLRGSRTVVSKSNLADQIAGTPAQSVPGAPTVAPEPPLFANEAERKVAQVTVEVIKKHENLAGSKLLLTPEVQKEIAKEVAATVAPVQRDLPGVTEPPDIAAVVAKTADLIVKQTIDIPRILVVPKGQVTTGFHSFKVDCSGIHYQPVERDLLIQHLRTHAQETLTSDSNVQQELRDEDYIVRGLVDFDDISCDEHADLLYNLAGQMVAHLYSYLSEDDVRNVIIYHQKQLAAFIHAQTQAHQWGKATDYDVVVTKGFTELKSSAFTVKEDGAVWDFQQTVTEKNRIPQMVFGGFRRCLYNVQKFQSDAERKLAVILDREALKWMKPANGQFQIFYKAGTDQREYVPDFVAEMSAYIYMLEPKARSEMEDTEVLAKRDSAVTYCSRASQHSAATGGKPWKYRLIPHDEIAENMTLAGLASRFAVSV